jgi:hypothetical protein
MDTFNFKKHPKKQEDDAGRKEVKEKEAERRKWKLKHRQYKVLTLGLNQITKYIYRLDGPLGEVTYSGLTQSVFILDRVKSSSCDCPAKIPVDSNARCFTWFSSGSSSPEVAEFCPTLLGLFYRSGLSLHLRTIQSL